MKPKTTKIVSVIALVLMVFAMALYVISDDEQFPPVADEPGANGPAAASLEMPATEAPAAE
jgi:hypothetical protein